MFKFWYLVLHTELNFYTLTRNYIFCWNKFNPANHFWFPNNKNPMIFRAFSCYISIQTWNDFGKLWLTLKESTKMKDMNTALLIHWNIWHAVKSILYLNWDQNTQRTDIKSVMYTFDYKHLFSDIRLILLIDVLVLIIKLLEMILFSASHITSSSLWYTIKRHHIIKCQMYIHHWLLVVYDNHYEFQNHISIKFTAFNSISKTIIIQQQIYTNIEM